jgi:hypothetical protein
MMKGTPVAWILESIDECAAKSTGLGLSTSALLSRLVGFCKNAKRPEVDPSAPVSRPSPPREPLPEFNAEVSQKGVTAVLQAMGGKATK